MCDVLLWFKEKNANSYSIEFKTQRFDIHIHIHIYIIQLTQRRVFQLLITSSIMLTDHE
jgi:hypothetical protein